MGVRLECEECKAASVSALFYRGAAGHRCHHCGGHLTLADPQEDRRSGVDRRDRIRYGVQPDWRSGRDRREADDRSPLQRR